jgi:alpha/beta superfamily hydrolase
VIDVRVTARGLLDDWNLYKSARPREHVFDIQYDKDNLQKWANFLQTSLLWENDEIRIVEACHQFESRLKSFKEKIVIELLTGGSA